MAQNHLGACPTLVSGLSGDCSCKKEITHYLYLAKWSFGLFVFEFVGGLFSGSIALISDSLHVLLDGMENIVSAVVSKLAQKNSNEEKLRKIGGKISAFMLLFAAGVIIHEGYERILTPHKVEWYMTLIAVAGLCVNLWQINIHRSAAKEHLNQTHFWQNWHLMSDIAASIAVVIGGLVMLITDGLYWVDGMLSICIGLLVVMFTVAKLLGVELHLHDNEHKNGDECDHRH